MNFQQKTFTELMTLCETNEAFYFADFTHPTDGEILRIFNYRLASYTDFLEPSAIHCRGTMFHMSDNGPVLVSLPMEKFWNLNENPMTMDLDLTTVDRIEVKADGSLISTYLLNSALWLKSKGSIASDQAMDAMKWLDRGENQDFKMRLLDAARAGYTVNMEWCAPHNRIVLPYQEERLVVLNVRCNVTGEYGDLYLLKPFMDNLVEVDDPVSFTAAIPDMEDIEGYILRLHNDDGTHQRVKVKTLWYLSLHRAKDSVNSDRRLFETVVCDAHDDLRSLFVDDQWVLDRIQWMEDWVKEEYNHMVASVEAFYNENKHLSRKDYAIKGQKEIKKMWFALAMNLYLGKENQYKEFMMKHWRDYGIKDQQKGEE